MEVSDTKGWDMGVNHRCAVLGKPIAHSLSPVLHNAAYRAMGLDDWTYDKHEVGEEDLAGFLDNLDPSWAGLSLTMPLKKTIQPYGAPSNLWARELKVANTAVFDWSETQAAQTQTDHTGNETGMQSARKPSVKLYNTDVIGIQLAFEHATREHPELNHPTSRSASALVIGNGNTASSAVAALTMMPEVGHITVAARHPGKNPTLKSVAAKFLPTTDPYHEINLTDDNALAEAAAESHFVISTIPGLAGDPVAEALARANRHMSGLLLDVVYDPRPTKLMRAWRDLGGLAIGGEEMLLYQALVQVLLMTGEWDGDPPSDADRRLQDTTDDDHVEIAMRRALEEAL